MAPELYREIVTMDDSFAIYRPPIKAEDKPGGESHYVKCRKLLLTNKVKAKELIARVIITLTFAILNWGAIRSTREINSIPF